MVGMQHQHQCSSKAFNYSSTVLYKLRKTYLIIDIEPVVKDDPKVDDNSFYSILKDYVSQREYIFYQQVL